MKFITVLLMAILIAVVVIVLDGKKNFRWRKDLPLLFRRKFNTWKLNDTCEYERIKSLAVNVSKIRKDTQLIYSISTLRIKEDCLLKKAELMLEVRGLSYTKSKTMKNKMYVADIQPIGMTNDGFSLLSSPAFIERNNLELSFDITSYYNSSRNNFTDHINFHFIIFRKNGKMANSLMKKISKVFVIVYEKTESCSFLDLVRRDERFRQQNFNTRVNVPRISFKTFPIKEMAPFCQLNPYVVNFLDMGFTWMIYPEEYNIGLCDGYCPISSIQTGYSAIQFFLSGKLNKNQLDTCRPTKFGSMTIIYEDLIDNLPVIAKLTGMVAKQCSCT